MNVFGSTDRLGLQVELLEPAGQHIVARIYMWAAGMRRTAVIIGYGIGAPDPPGVVNATT